MLRILLAAVVLSLLPTSAWSRAYYASPDADTTGTGTQTSPMRLETALAQALAPGDQVILAPGAYVGAYTIDGKHGTAAQPISIQAAVRGTANIDGSLPQFRKTNNNDWVRATPDGQAHRDEYVSVRTVTDFIRGAFLDSDPYTRLITYADLKDLRAENETFGVIYDPTSDLRCSQNSQAPSGTPRCEQAIAECSASAPPSDCFLASNGKRYRTALQGGRPYYLPHVYMGPGIWVDPSVGPNNPQKIHIRLSPTHNRIVGLADWKPPGNDPDPRRLALAISEKNMITLTIGRSSHITLKDLNIRYGGQQTAQVAGQDARPDSARPEIRNVSIVFDHVGIFASTFGIRSNYNTGLTFRDSRFDGGLPTWLFRNDAKDEYTYRDGDAAVVNVLAKQTVDALLLPGSADYGTRIEYNEFNNGHDIYVSARDLDMHHNWISNMNDEGMILDAMPKLDDGLEARGMRIYQNVIERTLNPISFAGLDADPGWMGPTRIYRNIIDLRRPVAGVRPNPSDRNHPDVWRHGSAFKSNVHPAAPYEGPYDLFQNTFLTYDRSEGPQYIHYYDHGVATKPPLNTRRVFNNIFLAFTPDSHKRYDAMSYIPLPSFPAQTDGNDYFQFGVSTPGVGRFRYSNDGIGAGCPFDLPPGGSPSPCYFASLAAFRTSELFELSKTRYRPGYEAFGLELDPLFERMSGDGQVGDNDDLRLTSRSPLIRAGVRLPVDLGALDPLAPTPPSLPEPAPRPDIGAIPYGSPALQVGVEGRRRFPR